MADSDFDQSDNAAGGIVERRDVVIGGAALAVAIATPLAVSPAAANQPDNLPLQPGDRIQLVTGAHKKKLLRPEMLETGERPFEGFPFDPASEILRRKNRLNRLLLLRLDLAEMNDVTRERSFEGVLAFSALCTHRACTVKSWMAKQRYLRCHCHLSQFAALESGRIKRGPAKRSLPMVPLGIDSDGFVVALDGFTGKPGAAKT